MSSDQRHGWWSVVRPPTLAGFCADYMAGGMVVVSPPYLSGKGGDLRLRPNCEEKCTVESACRRMRLDGSMVEGNECAVVVVVGDEWLLGEGQLVEGEQPTEGEQPPGGKGKGARGRGLLTLLTEGDQQAGARLR